MVPCMSRSMVLMQIQQITIMVSRAHLFASKYFLFISILAAGYFFLFSPSARAADLIDCSAYLNPKDIDAWEELQACEERMNSMNAIKKPQKLFNKVKQDNRLSSGIRWSFYAIEWCSPRYREISGWWNNACKRWYFQIHDKVAKIHWNGQNFSYNQDSLLYPAFRQAETQMRMDIAWVQKNPSNLALQSIFRDVMGLEMWWEWAFRIFAYTIDYADNIGKYELYYKIDKTAPSLTWWGITENSDYVYYTWAVSGLSHGVGVRNDSFLLSASSVINYWWNAITQRPRTDLGDTRPTLYYSINNQSFSTILSANDTWNLLVSSWAGAYPLWGRQVGALIAGIGTSIDLYGAYSTGGLVHRETITSFSSGVPAKSGIVWPGRTEYFTQNPRTQPSTAFYRFRVYDTTVGKAWGKGNYMEQPLYVVLDTTPPNGGSATGIVFFSGTTSICDQLLSLTGCTFSKFFTASDTRNLVLRLSDIDGGKGKSPYKHYNAWLLGSGSISHQIEYSQNPVSKMNYPLIVQNDYMSQTSIYHDFSKVDNELDIVWGYRYYGANFITRFPSWIQSSGVVCDRVRNCINIGDVSYRVMAGEENPQISTLSISWSTQKIIANGEDSYLIHYALKDSYGNKIIPVHSQEGSEADYGLIRDVISGFHLRSTLSSDMRSWVFDQDERRNVVTFTDTQADNRPPVLNTLLTSPDGNAKYLTHENYLSTSRNGEFSYQISSLVPTHDGYSWLAPDRTFSLNGSGLVVQSTTGLNQSQRMAAIYDTGSYLWTHGYSHPDGPMITGYSGLVENPARKYNITPEQVQLYGTLSGYVGPIASLDGKRLSFAFASPVAAFWNNLDALIDGTFKDYEYVTIFPEERFPLLFRGYGRYEKYPVCEIIPPATVCTDSYSEGNMVRYQFRNSTVSGSKGAIEYINGDAWVQDFFRSVQPGDARTLFASPSSFSGGFTAPSGLAFFSLPGKVYDKEKLRVGIVSWLSYTTRGGLTVMLPGPSRNIFSLTGELIPNEAGSYTYLQGTYSIWPAAQSVRFDSLVSDIGIIGYTNTYNRITSDSDISSATTLLGANISATLKNTFRKKAAEISRSLPDGKWCKSVRVNTPLTLDIEMIDTLPCTVDAWGGEITIFVQGDVNIACGTTTENICNMHGRKVNILVKNGILNIMSNITTLSDAGKDSGRVFIGSFVDNNENAQIVDTENVTLQPGWIGIDTRVTNLDAFVFTEGSILTTKSWARGNVVLGDQDLKNQLYVFGGLFSQNTVGWSRRTPPMCPYMVDANSCNQNIAQIFDLTFLRRYHLVNKAQVTGNLSDSGSFVPYDQWLRAWGWYEMCTASSSGSLRCVPLIIYQGAPIVLEKNELWTRDPSVFMNK